jgi:hypothetical protein
MLPADGVAAKLESEWISTPVGSSYNEIIQIWVGDIFLFVKESPDFCWDHVCDFALLLFKLMRLLIEVDD